MTKIHPTSVVEPGAEIADDAVVGPFCHIGPKAVIGPGCHLMSHIAVHGRTTLGAHNKVWPHVTLGADPQDLKFQGEDSELIIGDHNDIRECVTIHKGTAVGGNVTRVGDHNLIMAYCHIGHDCLLGSHIVIANSVQLAGHILIEDHANLGGATAVHHWVTIRQYAFVGGMTRIVQDVPPFMVVEGIPARVRGVNVVGLKRHRFPEDQVDRLKLAYRRLYRAEEQPLVGTFSHTLADLEAEQPDDWCIQALADALRKASNGVFGRHREAARTDNRYTNPVR